MLRMHPIRTRNILEIDEILRTFLRWCDKPTLACLARTSKFFSDPALDVLWENLESFAYLLKVFPEELIAWAPAATGGPLRPVSLTLQFCFEMKVARLNEGCCVCSCACVCACVHGIDIRYT